MKTTLNGFQIIGALLLFLGLLVGYKTYDIFFAVGYNPDIVAGFLFWFVAVPGMSIGLLTLLIGTALSGRPSKNNVQEKQR